METYKELPKKHMGGGVFIRDEQGAILIVKPTYKDFWEVVGGIVEGGESPREAARREAREELGIDVDIGRCLCVDFCSPEGGQPDSLQFIFDGGIFTSEIINKIRLPQDELSEFRFMPIERALPYMSPRKRWRLPNCLEAAEKQVTLYLENGKML